MKAFYKPFLIASFFLLSINEAETQTTLEKLNQIELIKQFIGTWKCEFGKDTIMIGEITPFGTGLVANSQIIANGKTLESVKQLYGYEAKTDKFIVAELIESSPIIEICTTWFTSKNTGEMIVTNPDNVPLQYKFEFKTPDIVVQTAIKDNKVIKEIILTRIKTNK